MTCGSATVSCIASPLIPSVRLSRSAGLSGSAMFTGLVEDTGSIVAIRPVGNGIELTIRTAIPSGRSRSATLLRVMAAV